jgi:hypothetical protein
MKLQYFAKRTKNDELLSFVLAELNGYKEHGNLPDYRMSSSVIHVDIQFGETKHSNLEMPVEILDEKYRNIFRKFYLKESVSILEHMAKNKEVEKGNGQYLIFNFPLTLINIFQEAAAKLYKNPYFHTEVVGARQLGNSNILPAALTSIRSRLLTFCMEIGDAFGYNIAIESFNKSQSSNNEKIIHLMSTVINTHGDGNVVNSGENANINATITISKGNKGELTKKFQELGIETVDIEEITQIVE